MAASPTVLRRRLGGELRNLRRAKNLSAAQVAKQLGWSESKVSRIEGGKSPLSDQDAKLLLAEYGVDDPEEVRQFIGLTRQSRQNGWWHSYGDALPEWFKPYLGFESDAASILACQTELVPGLLQTERYAQAVIRALEPELSVDEVEARASARIKRQDVLTSGHPPRLWAILNEAVVRRIVGSPDVMREQLVSLADRAETLPNVTVQVLPFDAGAHQSMGYSFLVLSFEDIPGSIVYSEGPTSATYLDKESDLRRHEDIFQRLVAASERPEKSIAMIRSIAEEYSHAG
ncbi:helix-turn-helix protein [Streptomyces sp. BK022]|uniref:helix-turn-helix domain-containing protein n=1 Tax=Streptomyces sp. BK022 TaxID=2512123 RepID=UPI00102A100E|nr:helix-turn-helix transcriptional regulator [Streptomyces sp. BK022]RZU36049.1 helix-turn-helix protein [Streptomyces sp. BK022]